MKTETAVETAKTENELTDLQKAQAKIEQIRTAILNGDEKLTSQDLANARGELEFAELRQAAATEREQKRVEAERRESLSSVQKRLSEIPKAESFDKLLSDIEKPLEKYLSKMKNRNDEISDIHQKLIDGGYIVGHVNFAPVEGISVEAPTVNSPLIIGDVEAKGLDPREKVEKFVGDILQRYFPRIGR